MAEGSRAARVAEAQRFRESPSTTAAPELRRFVPGMTLVNGPRLRVFRAGLGHGIARSPLRGSSIVAWPQNGGRMTNYGPKHFFQPHPSPNHKKKEKVNCSTLETKYSSAP